jgi:hypothetical protein
MQLNNRRRGGPLHRSTEVGHKRSQVRPWGSIVATGIVVAPGGERTEAGRVSAAVVGDSPLRGEAGGARGRGRSAGGDMRGEEGDLVAVGDCTKKGGGWSTRRRGGARGDLTTGEGSTVSM